MITLKQNKAVTINTLIEDEAGCSRTVAMSIILILTRNRGMQLIYSCSLLTKYIPESMRSMYSILLAAFMLLNIAAITQPKTPDWVNKVGSRKVNLRTVIYSVNKYGAVNDGKTLATKSIQRAIDEAAAKGGGIVSFAPGKYLTGSLFIKTGVNLQVNKGVEILGSQDIRDYPEIDTRVAGIEMKWPAALINILKQHKAGISGAGLVNAQCKPFWDAYWQLRKEYDPKELRWIVDYDAKRPRTTAGNQFCEC